jgi:beta-lactamase regulating signal transducer with metallopeptidase domain
LSQPTVAAVPDLRPASTAATLGTKVIRPSTAHWVLIAWAIGFCGAIFPTVIGLAGNEARRRKARRVTDPVWMALLEELNRASRPSRTVELRQSRAVLIPITWGIVRPVILLPADADVWAEPLRRAVLQHELAHIRRCDVALQFVGRLAAALYWFHPLAWYALARLRVECEYAADDCLIQAGHRRSDYAEQLLAVARSVRRLRTAAAVAMARGNSLEGRLRALFDDARSHRPLNRRAAFGLFAALALVMAALASIRPVPAPASPPPAKVSQQAASTAKSAGTVTGQVIGTNSDTGAGLPVAGASVYLLRRPRGPYLLPTHPRSTQANAEGRFTFTKVTPGSYFLWAESGNRVSNLEELHGERIEITANAAPAPFTLRLTEASRIRIHVTAKADGRPIAKAAIRFLWPDIERRFETDAKGIALIEGVRPREHVFQVVAEGFAVQVLTVAATQPGTKNDLAFSLEPGGQIRGTVRDGQGQTMPFVRVGLQPASGRALLGIEGVRTDSNGRFVFDNVPLGETLEISVGYQNRRKNKTVRLSSDQKNVTADVAFDKKADGGSVLVHVMGPHHKPIAGAEISNPGSSTQWWRKGMTDDNGDCQLDHLYDLSGRYRLFVRAKGFAPQELNFIPGTALKPARLNVELERGHTIRGRVMLTSGKPAGNLRVFYGGGEHPWTIGGDTRTDAEGRFSLDSLPPECTFTIYPPSGYAPFREQRLPLDRESEVTVTLDTAALVKGRVVDDARGKPAIPYRIRVMGSPNHRRGEPWPLLDSRLADDGRTILDPDGRFEFGGLPPGAPMRLMMSAPGYVDYSLDRVIARPEGEFKPLEVRLQKINPKNFRTVTGRLVGADGKPFAGVELRLWTSPRKLVNPGQYPFNWTMIESGQLEQSPECQQFLTAVTGKDGEFTFSNVRVAGYGELAYWGKGTSAGRETIHLTADSEPVITLTVRAEAAARLVVEIDRKVWPNAGQIRIWADSRVFGYRLEGIGRDQQRSIFEDLPAGSVNVSLMDAGRDLGDSRVHFETLTQRKVTLKSGETTTIRFDKR